MAEKNQKTYDVFSPPVGRGRGLLSPGKTFVNDTPRATSKIQFVLDDGRDKHEPTHSTPTDSSEHTTTHQLRELIGELGSQIGESIASRFLACQPALSSQALPYKSLRAESFTATADASQISLIVRPDIKDPSIFRGDGTDKYSIHEWIDTVDVYLQKRDLPPCEQAEDVLNHLCGKAKSIVKVGLKSSSISNIPVAPETVYNILWRYFSDTPSSCLPLADFYATQPKAKETLVDYWIRLNTAAEVADRHLKCQGGKMDNMDSEIAMMFVRNCPDPNLASVFKCKPTSKWSLADVQEAIDEHQRECQAKKTTTTLTNAHALRVATAVTASEPLEYDAEYTNVNTAKLSDPVKPGTAVGSESSALERVLSMLERVLEHTNQTALSATRPETAPFSYGSPCRVCRQTSHSTRTHCMREKRCLECLETGHQRKDCPKGSSNRPHFTASGKLKHSHEGGDSVSDRDRTLKLEDDAQTIYSECVNSSPSNTVVLFQNINRIDKADSLFYTDAEVEDKVSLKALLDTGSMTCTISEEAELVGCGELKLSLNAFMT